MSIRLWTSMPCISTMFPVLLLQHIEGNAWLTFEIRVVVLNFLNQGLIPASRSHPVLEDLEKCCDQCSSSY